MIKRNKRNTKKHKRNTKRQYKSIRKISNLDKNKNITLKKQIFNKANHRISIIYPTGSFNNPFKLNLMIEILSR